MSTAAHPVHCVTHFHCRRPNHLTQNGTFRHIRSRFLFCLFFSFFCPHLTYASSPSSSRSQSRKRRRTEEKRLQIQLIIKKRENRSDRRDGRLFLLSLSLPVPTTTTTTATVTTRMTKGCGTEASPDVCGGEKEGRLPEKKKKGKVIKSCHAATLGTFCGSREEPQGGPTAP